MQHSVRVRARFSEVGHTLETETIRKRLGITIRASECASLTLRFRFGSRVDVVLKGRFQVKHYSGLATSENC